MTPVMLLIRICFFHFALFIEQKEQEMINIATNLQKTWNLVTFGPRIWKKLVRIKAEW